jgi:methylthioribose-1-phosphate isomerase
MRTIEWNYDTHELLMINQRLLPGKLLVESYNDYQGVATAIRDMTVRGAPAIGAAAAFGLALAGYQSRARTPDELIHDLEKAVLVLRESRPTAVNLSWALNRIMAQVRAYSGPTAELKQFILVQAQKLADEDVETNKRMAEHGAVLINDGDTVIHHCNTGALATVDWGTALGVIRTAHEQGKRVHVLVDETRPRLQGARLSAWELEHMESRTRSSRIIWQDISCNPAR